jgi:hypothetical protein
MVEDGLFNPHSINDDDQYMDFSVDVVAKPMYVNGGSLTRINHGKERRKRWI